MRQRWKNALIVKLLGKKIGVGFMKKKLESFWARTGSVTVADLGNEFFSVRFTSLEDLNLAITGGPWVIFGHYLATRKWEPYFDPEQANIHKVAAWVRLQGIPQEYCEYPFLSQLGTVIGKVLKVDKTTSTGDWARFARVCIEIDLAKPLRGEYILDGCLKKVEYEGLFLICLRYGRYGHNSDSCPDFAKPVPMANPVPVPEQPVDISGVQGVGLWMVVQRRKKGGQGNKKAEVSSNRYFGEDLSNKNSKVTTKKSVSVINSQKSMPVNVPTVVPPTSLVNKENLSLESETLIQDQGMKFSAKAAMPVRKPVGSKPSVASSRKLSSKAYAVKGKGVTQPIAPVVEDSSSSYLREPIMDYSQGPVEMQKGKLWGDSMMAVDASLVKPDPNQSEALRHSALLLKEITLKDPDPPDVVLSVTTSKIGTQSGMEVDQAISSSNLVLNCVNSDVIIE
ncbi:uncharacterized protein LOC133308945 [Gastrolobium bilobum]|uniref:uncharacterized protein LOC133308945 n=1 Tax=Gastrolobium bilobum TaxID=150636 RepID=UPI002AAF98B5|nr:uncharacterized protein LOC133308945 [Gastrolobium bilobum]